MGVEGLGETIGGLADVGSWQHVLEWMLWQSSAHGTVLAQDLSRFDIIGDLTKAFNNFIQSGQVWALLIGLVVGYLLKSITK